MLRSQLTRSSRRFRKEWGVDEESSTLLREGKDNALTTLRDVYRAKSVPIINM